MWDFGSLTIQFDGRGDTLQLDSISPEASLMDIDTVAPIAAYISAFATKEGQL